LFSLLSAVFVTGTVLLTGGLPAQEGDPPPGVERNVTWPQFVVVFNYQLKLGDPLVNMRVVLRAKNEGDASVRALLHLQKSFNVDGEKLEFVEAVEKVDRPPDTPKK
jgi:hypothetical protein